MRITPDLIEGLNLPRDPLHVRIARQIQQLISDKGFPPGSQLPSERELATACGASRATVHQAINLLQQQGLLEIRVGSGTFVRAVPASVVTESMERYTVFGRSSQEEILFLREALEPEMAALAAKEATAEELVRLKELVDQLEEKLNADGLSQPEADAVFHLALARASHNQLLVAVYSGLQSAMKNAMHLQVGIHDSRGQHRRIQEAVAQRDAAAARQAMEAHLRFTRATAMA